MGTSQSSPGLGRNAPLVPPWADAPSDKPVEMTGFRQAMRSVAQGVGKSGIERALGHYAREVTGGSQFATRRFGHAIQGGANLYGALSGTDTELIDITLLVNKPCDEAIATISQALSSENGDADKIHAAMTQALADALEGVNVFTMDAITPDVLSATLVNYHAEIFSNQIMQDAGNAWDKATEPAQIIAAENDLRQLVLVIVDKHMTPKLQSSRHGLNKNEIIRIEKLVIQEVWEEWRAYQ